MPRIVFVFYSGGVPLPLNKLAGGEIFMDLQWIFNGYSWIFLWIFMDLQIVVALVPQCCSFL